MAVPRRLSDRRWGSASRCRDEADSVFGQQQRGIRSVQGTRAREQASWMESRQGLRHDKALALAGLPPGPLQPRNTGASDKPPPPGGKRRPAPLPPCLPADWAGRDWLPRTTPSPRAAVMEIMGIRPSPAAGTRRLQGPYQQPSISAPHAAPSVLPCLAPTTPHWRYRAAGVVTPPPKKVRLRCVQVEGTKLRTINSLDTRVCPTGSLCKTSIPQWTNMPHHPKRDVSTATPCPAWTSPHP
ncbi:hypothetical protein COCCADRAFT_26765 [Bipolaris zeicola 26-R-13]|uniref:Uncharacterized protein n=1 Tax=Cochliobolus carbonum (strain 26-R-13) TaxID=930089 RepID=W6XZ98_COCC2|nr:uncharacterized protein COCCADRAFT_26765 [Bipolaris zeicola 26-R-13]EUC32797.1 hypothetical protein COCCADRAFT_26765 [Bipolaris zeicola 26-R-13]